jgi:hypothetical protein
MFAIARSRSLQLRDSRCAASLPVRPPVGRSKSRGTARALQSFLSEQMEKAMGFGRGLLLWLIGIPLPIIIVLALFMHH